MDTATIIATAVAVGALVLVTVLAVAMSRQNSAHRRELTQVLERTEAETRQLRSRLDELQQAQRNASAELMITDAGQPPRQVDDRVVVSATLGEPLIKVVSTAYALRRSLSAENRNRIFFEMRREVRRARKQRRREMRAAWRESRLSEDVA